MRAFAFPTLGPAGGLRACLSNVCARSLTATLEKKTLRISS